MCASASFILLRLHQHNAAIAPRPVPPPPPFSVRWRSSELVRAACTASTTIFRAPCLKPPLRCWGVLIAVPPLLLLLLLRSAFPLLCNFNPPALQPRRDASTLVHTSAPAYMSTPGRGRGRRAGGGGGADTPAVCVVVGMSGVAVAGCTPSIGVHPPVTLSQQGSSPHVSLSLSLVVLRALHSSLCAASCGCLPPPFPAHLVLCWEPCQHGACLSAPLLCGSFALIPVAGLLRVRTRAGACWACSPRARWLSLLVVSSRAAHLPSSSPTCTCTQGHVNATPDEANHA